MHILVHSPALLVNIQQKKLSELLASGSNPVCPIGYWLICPHLIGYSVTVWSICHGDVLLFTEEKHLV